MKLTGSENGVKANTALYLDNTSLVNIKKASDQKGELETVAKQFEAMFLQLVLRQMRSSSDVMADEDSPFSSKQQSVFRDMYDGQMSVEMAKKQSAGIADMLVKQLSPNTEGAESNVVHLSSLSTRKTNTLASSENNSVNSLNNVNNTVAFNRQEQTEVKATSAFSQPLIRKLER